MQPEPGLFSDSLSLSLSFSLSPPNDLSGRGKRNEDEMGAKAIFPWEIHDWVGRANEKRAFLRRFSFGVPVICRGNKKKMDLLCKKVCSWQIN